MVSSYIVKASNNSFMPVLYNCNASETWSEYSHVLCNVSQFYYTDMILKMDTKFMNVNYVYSTFVIQLIKKKNWRLIFLFMFNINKKMNRQFFLLLVLKIHECSQLEKGKGLIIPCLVDNIENVTGNCHTYLEKMARIVFSDYRLIYHFVDQCSVDIEQLKCGRIGPADENVSQV